MFLGQVINFNRLLRLFGEYLLRICKNFTQMPLKEKDLEITILWTYTVATHLQTDIKPFERMLQKLK